MSPKVFLNLTAHSINLPDLEIEPSGLEVRLFPKPIETAPRGGVPAVVNVFSKPEVERVEREISDALASNPLASYAVVSTFVLLAMEGRKISDALVAPDTSPASAIRDDAGRIIGVKRFQVNE